MTRWVDMALPIPYAFWTPTIFARTLALQQTPHIFSKEACSWPLVDHSDDSEAFLATILIENETSLAPDHGIGYWGYLVFSY